MVDWPLEGRLAVGFGRLVGGELAIRWSIKVELVAGWSPHGEVGLLSGRGAVGWLAAMSWPFGGRFFGELTVRWPTLWRVGRLVAETWRVGGVANWLLGGRLALSCWWVADRR